MRILFVCNEYPPLRAGGIGIFVKSLAEYTIGFGFEIYVHCLNSNYKVSFWEEINGVRIFRGHFRKSGFKILDELIFRIKQSRSIRHIVRTESIDLVESYEWAGPILLHPKVPFIVRLHGGHHAHAIYENRKGSRLLQVFEKRILGIADHVVSVSKHMARLTRYAYALNGKVEVIYNFYDSKKFFVDNNVTRDPKLIIFVGKFHTRKGVHEMFDRLNELLTVDSGLRFKFIGDYESVDADGIIDQLETDVASRTEFIGRVAHDQLHKYYQTARITLIPSRAEAFGLIAIEAMACGSIVIMNNGHVSNELINDGENGYRIDYCMPRSLSNLFSSFESQEHLDLISKAAVESVEDFQIEKIVQQNLEYYRYILHQC